MRSVLALAVIALLLFCVLPVVLVFGDSFVASGGGLTLAHYATAFGRADLLKSIRGSLLVATTSTLLAIAIGVPFALFTSRVRTPLRGLFSALYVLPLVLPPLMLSMGWSQFMHAIQGHPAAPSPATVLGGLHGATFLFGLAHFPFVVLFARKAFLEIGAGFEEAARVSAGPLRAFLRVTLPLAAPSILAGGLFAFLFTIADFSVVDYLSTVAPVKTRFVTYPFTAFSAWQTSYTEFGRRAAAAAGLPLAVISVGLLAVIYWLIRKGRYVSVVSGHARPGDIEAQSRPATRAVVRVTGLLVLVVVLVLSVAIPLGRIFEMALGKDGRLALHLSQALVKAGGLHAFGNSLLNAGVAAAVMSLLAVVLGHHMVRRGPRREALVLTLSLLPLAFGPIMYGAGLMRMWNHSWLEVHRFNPIYDTWVIVVFLLVGKYLPFALAAVTSSMRRLDPGYEEAAAVSGAGPLRRMLAVISPLVLKGIAAGFVLGFIFSLRELDTAYMFDAGNNTAMTRIYQMVHFARDANVACLCLVMVLLIALPLLIYWLLTARRLRVI